MGIPCYLAMTEAEMAHTEIFPRHSGWMACHFSPYGTGLSNLPDDLPPDCLLILNDRTPNHGHDPELVCRQLSQCITRFHCPGLLLDFQQKENPELQELVSYLIKQLSCPVAVSAPYAAREGCAVFLPPVPPSDALTDSLAPWKGREIWLEVALGGEIITLTEHGAESVPLPYPDLTVQSFCDEQLHCHYRVSLSENRAEFTLWRTVEDLYALAEEAEGLGVTAMVGLYQELVERGHDPAGNSCVQP